MFGGDYEAFTIIRNYCHGNYQYSYGVLLQEREGAFL